MILILQSFRNTCADARRFVAAAHVQNPPGGAYLWPQADRFLAVEAAFLKTFIAWEHFQEEAFHHLLLGRPTGSGRVIARFALPLDAEHATRILVGTAKHVDWSVPDTVRKLAKLYLQGGDPFENVLPAVHSDLLDLKTIRNAAAHLSTTTTAPLEALASRLLGVQASKTNVAELLLSAVPGQLGLTIFGKYAQILDTAANQIVMA
jgi:hypothetical protein